MVASKNSIAGAPAKASRSLALILAATASLAAQAQHPAPLPHLAKVGAVTQLIVDGSPLILLAGELHNSSPSSPAYMRPIWDRLEAMHLNAVIGAASWELVEPQEGHFDFTAVDDEVRQAHAHHMHLVLIWFGSFKNASYTYTPMWVKRDPRRFPLAQTEPRAPGAALRTANTLSVFGSASERADAHAFAALMAHLRNTDSFHTVVMIQVENETGLRGDSRDRSPLAEAAYNAPVPQELLSWMNSHRDTMLPELRAVWTAAGARTQGTWPEVFGANPVGDEAFMAWYTARYINTVAEAGSRKLPLPMYVNAWIVQYPGQIPGGYPSGGPVSRMMDIWKLAGPRLALQAPDIYLGDYEGVCASYTRDENTLFVPEAGPSVAKLFVTIAKFNGIGYSPFGIDGIEDDTLSSAYETLGSLMGPLTTAIAKGEVQLIPAAAGGEVDLDLGEFTLHIERGAHGNPPRPKNFERENAQSLPPAPGEAVQSSSRVPAVANTVAKGNGYLRPFDDGRVATGMIIPNGPDSFYLIGEGLALSVSSRRPDRVAHLGMVDEGRLENGHWLPGRRLNGDETFGASRILLAPDVVKAVSVTLYSVPQ
ncbi:MAG TPA: DUF5597 domain-containing protein [Edaphobacter sp.]|nr:DUF5597 domain-containing protein [Edaphobacter sp.]